MGRTRNLALATVLIALGLSVPLPAVADELDARLDWGERYVISTPLAGLVREVRIKPGDQVEKDQVLFNLDTRRLQADARGLEAERARLRLELAEADREVSRAEELYDRTLIAIRELELARIQKAMASARVDKVDADLRKIRIDLDDSQIRAPATARVLSVTVTPGEAVSPALAPPVLATLGSGDPMRATTTVDANVAGRLQLGQSARVRLGGGDVFDGSVAAIGWEIKDIGFGPGYRLDIVFSPPETAALRAGQSARITLPALD